MRRIALATARVLGLLVLLTSSCINSGADQLPDWMQLGVRAGSGRLDKKLFLSLDNIGSVTDIQRGELRSSGIIELGVAGNYGATVFDEHGKQDASVNFAVREPDEFRVSADIVSQSHSNGLLFFRHA